MWHEVKAHELHKLSGESVWQYSSQDMPDDTRKVFVIMRFEYLYSTGPAVVRNQLHITRWNGVQWLNPYSLPTDGRVTHWCELSELELPKGVELHG